MSKSAINEYFDVVFVLNLERRTDRKLAMLQKLSRLGIKSEFVKAENGYEAPFYGQYKVYSEAPLGGENAHEYELSYNKKMIRSAGAWGYLKTWEKIIERSIDKNYDRILCLDDDVFFHKDFERQFAISVRHIPPDWKLLYLGASQHSWTLNGSLFYPNRNITSLQEDQPCYHPALTDGSFAVGVHSTVFRVILEEIRKMNCSLDSGPLRKVMRIFPNRCFVLMPNLIIADVSDSDIGNSRNQADHAIKMKWDLSRYDLNPAENLVSVIMPAYNAEDTIEKAIQSILLQSYKNLELIVVDDGSKDKTAMVVEKVASRDSRIKFIRNQSNQGCYFTRNRGIKAASGTAIAIQDSDDIALEKRLEKQLIPLFTGEAEFTLGRIYRSRFEMSELDVFDQPAMMKLVESRRIPQSNGRFKYHDRANLGFVTSVFSRKTIEELGLFLEERFAADMEFLERILFHRIGKTFGPDLPNAHEYLSECNPIPGVYKRLDEVVLVSSKMKKTNITNTYTKKQLEAFQANWRSAFTGEYPGNYPQLSSKSAASQVGQKRLFTFFEQGELQSERLPSSDAHYTFREARELEQKIRALTDQNKWLELDKQALLQSYSWRITRPFRIVAEYFIRTKF
jgi:glycosyltransferase involved in cell wall biosynthesis